MAATDPTLKIVTLAELKLQMRVEENDEDNLITLYGIAAERQIITETRRSMQELCAIGYEESNGEAPSGDIDAKWFPAMLRTAILMFAAQLYRYREPVISGTIVADVPYSIEVLVKPYVRLSNNDNRQ